MNSWRCVRLRPRLVEFADGTLAESGRPRIERHLTACPRCAETVLDLREVPAEIRRLAAPEPSEEFWIRQRRAILEAIEKRPVGIREMVPAGPRALLWGTSVALAASLALVLFLSQSSAPPAGAPPSSLSTTVRAAARAARVESPPGDVGGEEESASWMEDTLFPEDTSLLGLAAELDEGSVEASDNALI